MPWVKTPDDRRRDAQRYGPAWRKARDVALRRAGGRCETCGSSDRVQVDHVDGAAADPGHTRLQVLCKPCHDKKTASEGGGFRNRPDPPPSPRTRW